MKIYKIVFEFEYFDFDPDNESIVCHEGRKELGYFSSKKAAEAWIKNNGWIYQDGQLFIVEIDVEEEDE